jgi:uncharacterized membrane protein (DUF2068 family)
MSGSPVVGRGAAAHDLWMGRRREGLILAIGGFKLVKASVLAVAGIATFLEPPRQMAGQAERLVTTLGITTGRSAIERMLGKVWTMNASDAHRLAVLALIYGAVFVVEGVGLVLERRWAEWLTVFVTGSFIPFEIYELARHPGAGKVITLVLNVAIVAYLVWRRLAERAGGRRVWQSLRAHTTSGGTHP